MSLRERKDCTEEELVPRASAIQSSVLPASTHSLIWSMWGFNAMRFLESAILPPAPSGPSSDYDERFVKQFIDELLMMSLGILPSHRRRSHSSRSEAPGSPPLPASGAAGSFFPPDSCSTP